MLLERDCVGYSVDSDIKISSKKISNFEEIETLSDSVSYQVHRYNWVDPIRYREKFISKTTKSVSIIYLKSDLTFFLFGNSESNITYVVSRLKSLFSIHIEKLDLYPKIVSELLSKNKKYKIVNIQFVRETDQLEKWISLDTVGLSQNELSKILREETPQAISLYLEFNNTYFTVDVHSSMSFNDTSSIPEIVGVLKYVGSCFS
ncbi:hypothetical protein [Paenibacillus sp. FSL R7-0272]|uniref:hypothetical protein n=1 Tax=Paenibacillus sp. FSL R7-0272 TaxID=2921679 RepID=UPI0030EE0F54